MDGAFVSNSWDMTLSGRDLPEAVRTQSLSASGLTVLGVPPLLGRVFTEADGPAGEQPQRVVVLTYRFWQRHFGGRPEAVGQTLHLNREPYTVIGVLPRQYFQTGPELFVPMHVTFDSNVYGASTPVSSGASRHAWQSSDCSRSSTSSPKRTRNAFRGRRGRSSGRWRRDNGRQTMSRPCC